MMNQIKKKIISCLIALMVVNFLFVPTMMVQAAGNVNVSVSGGSGEVGAEVQVTISISASFRDNAVVLCCP